jgi:hypothetical protein
MQGAVYASVTLAALLVLGYVLVAYGGPIGKALVTLALTPVVLIVLGGVFGLVVGFAAGCVMPWVKRLRQQQTGAAVADPFEAALALAENLPMPKWAPFMYQLKNRWGLDAAISKEAREFLARHAGGTVQ